MKYSKEDIEKVLVEYGVVWTDCLSDKLLEMFHVVTCSECKYWTNNISDSELRDNFCNRRENDYFNYVTSNDFCSHAERIGEDE